MPPLTLDGNLFDFRESTFEKAPQTDRAYKRSILRDPFFPLQTTGPTTATHDKNNYCRTVGRNALEF